MICSSCKKTVRSNQKAIFSDEICKPWIHLKYTPFNNNEYDIFGESLEDWFCTLCLTTTFPFNHIDDDNEFLLALQEFKFRHAL